METAINFICYTTIIYGLTAITATIINYNKKPQTPQTPQTNWATGNHPIQTINLMLSMIMLTGFAILGLGNEIGKIIGAPTILLYFIPLLTTPFFIGFNIPLIWNKKIVNQEKQALKNKNKLILTQKIFLWTTWAVGYLLITVAIIDTIITPNITNHWPL